MALKQKGKFPDLNKAVTEMKRTLPLIIGNTAKNHYLKGFRNGGKQTDDSRGGWAKRKRADKSKKRRAILVKTGQLRNDVDVRRTSFREIVLGTLDTAYASFHNEGTDALPQREFLGESRELNAKLVRLMQRKFQKAFK